MTAPQWLYLIGVSCAQYESSLTFAGMSNILQSYLPHLKLLLSTNDDAGTQPQSRLPKVTRTRVALAIVGILGFLSAPSIWQYATSRHTVIVLPISEDHDGLPPLYSSYHFDELALPQNNPDLPFPEGRTGKYVWFRDSVRGESSICWLCPSADK